MSAEATQPEGTSKSTTDRFEAVIATLLGLAAILVAVSSYQASLRDGDSIKSFNEGIRAVSDSNGWFNEATQTSSRDETLFVEYAKATQEGNTDLATYIETSLMDDNLRKAVKEWQDTDADSPLETESYQLEAQAEGERLTKVTDQKFTEAKELDGKGDQLNLVGVIVASSLFFLGIAGVASSRRIKLFGTALGAVTLIVSTGLWLSI